MYNNPQLTYGHNSALLFDLGEVLCPNFNLNKILLINLEVLRGGLFLGFIQTEQVKFSVCKTVPDLNLQFS